MISCSKCYSNEIEGLVWIDLLTNEVLDRCDEYNCRSCGGRVEVIVTPDPEWIEDVEPINDEHEKEETPTIRVSAKLPEHLDTSDE
jgi:hypothetical protein